MVVMVMWSSFWKALGHPLEVGAVTSSEWGPSWVIAYTLSGCEAVQAAVGRTQKLFVDLKCKAKQN